MNTDQVSGKVDQLTGKIKEKWGLLTKDDVALYEGKRDQFFGKLEELYGLERDEAEKQIRDLKDAQTNRAA